MTGRLIRVYLGLLVASVASVFLTLILTWTPTPEDMQVDEANLRGGVMLAVERLDAAARSGADVGAARAALVETFGYPIEILSADAFDLAGRPMRVASSLEDPSYVYAALASGQIMRFGPLPSYDWPVDGLVAGFMILMVSWALVAIVIVRPQWRALQAMEAAAARLARGDWGTRVGEAVPAHAQPMARAFDRMADEVEAHLAARRRMMQVVSHELRTPLTRIQFGVDLLDVDDPEARQAQIEAVYADIDALDGLVDELQTFVRIDRAAPPQREAVDLGPALDALLAEANGAERDIMVRRSPLPADAPPVVADPRLFDRAVGNLVRNAGRYAATRVELTAERVGAAWRVSVTDDGPGIPPDARERVWSPFVRLDPEASPGSGLGLAIVRRIVRDHGGTATIEAAPEGGARVVTVWPDELPT